jgi:hypothetical protein
VTVTTVSREKSSTLISVPGDKVSTTDAKPHGLPKPYADALKLAVAKRG